MKELSLRRGWIVTTGREPRSIGGGIEVVPWDGIVRGEIDLRLG